MEQWEVFKDELAYIKSDVVVGLVKKALSNVHPKFFKAPASSSGRYHPLYTLGDGGLVRHTKAVVYFLNQLLELEYNQIKYGEEVTDCLYASAILHDSCKNGKDWDGTGYEFNHPMLVDSLLNMEDMSEDERHSWINIISLIQTHMGQWYKKDSITLLKPCDDEHMMLHMCDYLASRRDIHLMFFDSCKKEKNDWTSDPITQKQYDKILDDVEYAKKIGAIEDGEALFLVESLDLQKSTKGWASKTISYLSTCISDCKSKKKEKKGD